MSIEILEQKLLRTEKWFSHETEDGCCIFETDNIYDTTYGLKDETGTIVAKSKKEESIQKMERILNIVDSIRNNESVTYICRQCSYVDSFWEEWKIEKLRKDIVENIFDFKDELLKDIDIFFGFVKENRKEITYQYDERTS